MEPHHLLALAGLVVMVGSFVQGVTGFGMGLVAVPFLAFIVPERLPQVLVALMIPATLWHLVIERRSLRVAPVMWVLTGRVLGTAPGVLVVAVMTERGLQIIFGTLTIAAVTIMLASRLRLRTNRTSQLSAGLLSGVMATSASVGGPPLVMLYADRPGREARAFISGVVLPGNLASVAGLWLSGRLVGRDLTVIALLVGPMLLGLGLSRFAVRWVDRDRFRTVVLLVVVATSLLLIGQAFSV